MRGQTFRLWGLELHPAADRVDAGVRGTVCHLAGVGGLTRIVGEDPGSIVFLLDVQALNTVAVPQPRHRRQGRGLGEASSGEVTIGEHHAIKICAIKVGPDNWCASELEPVKVRASEISVGEITGDHVNYFFRAHGRVSEVCANEASAFVERELLISAGHVHVICLAVLELNIVEARRCEAGSGEVAVGECDPLQVPTCEIHAREVLPLVGRSRDQFWPRG